MSHSWPKQRGNDIQSMTIICFTDSNSNVWTSLVCNVLLNSNCLSASKSQPNCAYNCTRPQRHFTDKRRSTGDTEPPQLWFILVQSLSDTEIQSFTDYFCNFQPKCENRNLLEPGQGKTRPLTPIRTNITSTLTSIISVSGYK